mmetsp:Transcript_912/g.2713  ORF Transcript_912/g.2713 Transcript_912/m.2713 type:complete len:384 (-) Transcript_912:143-1294(-)
MAFSAKTLDIVRKTAPVVAENAVAITSTFYQTMFKNNPETLHYFNVTHQKTGAQPRVLAHAITAFASHIDDLSAISDAVVAMKHRHCALSVLPEHYPIVHDNLMLAIGEVLGDAVTPEIAEGWSNAVNGLSNILIAEEEKLYQELEARPSGWRGEREFVLSRKENVGTDTCEFEYVPASTPDGKAASFGFNAGQYTTVRIPGLEVAPRHYTVTSPVGIDTLAYTCRRVPGGVMSNYMHDELHEGDKVLLAPPCGTFMAPGVGDGAVVFTAGVGITPAWALVQTYGGDLIRAAVHVDKSVERDAFRDRFEKAGVHAQVWYTGESETERPDMSTIAQSVATEVGADSTYYVVGPREFMSDVFQGLDAAGATKRFSEVYGTGSLAV